MSKNINKPSTETNNKPIHEIRVNGIRASIWANATANALAFSLFAAVAALVGASMNISLKINGWVRSAACCYEQAGCVNSSLTDNIGIGKHFYW